MDVEGHELAVLQGYQGPLMMAEIGTSFFPFRKGVPLFDEIMNHMKSKEFLLLDLRRSFWSPGVYQEIGDGHSKGILIVGDALFIRDPFQKSSLELLKDRPAQCRYLAPLCAYGYAPEALMTVEILSSHGLLSDKGKLAIRHVLGKECGRPRHRFGRLAKVMLFLENWVRFPVSVRSGLFLSGFAQGDREVGNWR